MRPTGSNTENAIKLKEAVELRGYKATAEQKQYTMFVGEEWIEKQYSIYLTCAKGMLKHIRKKDMIDMCL